MKMINRDQLTLITCPMVSLKFLRQIETYFEAAFYTVPILTSLFEGHSSPKCFKIVTLFYS